MRHEEFEDLVIDAIGELPQELLARLDNVAVVVEQWPSHAQIADYVGETYFLRLTTPCEFSESSRFVDLANFVEYHQNLKC